MIEIRRVDLKDIDALSQLAFAAKAHWGYPASWMEQWRKYFTYTPEYFAENESWVAEWDGELAGFCTLLEKEGNSWLENLWVKPDFIGKGIGKQLFIYAVEIARSRGYPKMRLEADPHAEEFYKHMGMQKVGETPADMEGQSRILPVMEINL
jgi:GNAT superfamily N-acetyltransferase